jgi:hypothetical protein
VEINRHEILLRKVAPLVRISGSWARGEQREDSDVDLYVSEKNWKKVKQLLEGIKWDSCIVGHVAFTLDGKLFEFSTWFPRYGRRGRVVTVLGVDLKT